MFGSKLDLMPGETMVLSANPHWWYFWRQAAAGIGVVALFVLWWIVDVDWLSTLFGWLTVITFVAWLVNTVYEFIRWKTTRFAITNQRVAYQSGFIRRVGVSIPLNRVNNVNFEQGVIARLTNNGVVTIESAGETGDSVFENIADPDRVRTLIFAQVEADEVSDSKRDAAAIADALRGQAPSGGGTLSAKDRLSELENLHRQGLVSDSEFETKRRQILDEL